jgi:hypothetical protein
MIAMNGIALGLATSIRLRIDRHAAPLDAAERSRMEDRGPADARRGVRTFVARTAKLDTTPHLIERGHPQDTAGYQTAPSRARMSAQADPRSHVDLFHVGPVRHRAGITTDGLPIWKSPAKESATFCPCGWPFLRERQCLSFGNEP